MEQTVLRVKGMTCGHCKMAVENSLKKISGVKDAVVDLKEATVKVAYEAGPVTRQNLVDAVNDAGYEVV
ncbi:MAG: heavy-metal-associated domain-containing protein [Firmicutes bacterium]|nr:heavy-metal-associated domain-containing protein [Bacillota bacterium]